MLVSAIVVNHQRRALLEPCLASLFTALERVGGETEVVVVDNGSTDGSVELVREAFPEAQLVARPGNEGFPAAVNHGLARSRGQWVLLLNNDATIEADAVTELLSAADGRERVGSLAAQMRFAGPSPTINSAGIAVDKLGIGFDRLLGEPPAGAGGETVDVFGACGGAGLYRRAMLEDTGGFDGSLFFSLDDADLSWRARMRGWRCLYVPGAVVHHHHGGTVSHGSPQKYFYVGRNRVRLLAKNAERGHLVRYGAVMVAYDLAYVAFAAVTDRTLAPLRGRLRGLREWRRYRALGAATRGPVDLAPIQGLRAALRRRRSWRHAGSSPDLG